MASQNTSSYSFVVERDLRLDLLRGLGLWMIFLDHIPDDVVSWLTLRNYGSSDAAEFFVFISGYLLGFIYGPISSTSGCMGWRYMKLRSSPKQRDSAMIMHSRSQACTNA